MAWALPDRQWICEVELPSAATVADALAAARQQADPTGDIPWDSAPVGIFGEACTRATALAEGDRVELYRPLIQDPRESRRARVRAARKGR